MSNDNGNKGYTIMMELDIFYDGKWWIFYGQWKKEFLMREKFLKRGKILQCHGFVYHSNPGDRELSDLQMLPVCRLVLAPRQTCHQKKPCYAANRNLVAYSGNWAEWMMILNLILQTRYGTCSFSIYKYSTYSLSIYKNSTCLCGMFVNIVHLMQYVW